MKLAIMQPYLFPYLGYFQLINSVDNFVIYDDVNYLKQGWINRNRILVNNQPHYITLELLGASSFKKINDIQIGKNKIKILKTISSYYRKAPNFNSVFNLLENILNNKETNLALFLGNSIKLINEELKIDAKILVSSELKKNDDLKGQEKVISICKLLNAKTYINSIGGKVLYSKEKFSDENIDLKFLKSHEVTYKQFDSNFFSGLSIIDVMMFNSVNEIGEMLKKYELI